MQPSKKIQKTRLSTHQRIYAPHKSMLQVEERKRTHAAAAPAGNRFDGDGDDDDDNDEEGRKQDGWLHAGGFVLSRNNKMRFPLL